MRVLLLFLLGFTSLPLAAQDQLTLRDPRGQFDFYEWITDGKENKKLRPINNSLLILCRTPGPDGTAETFEINGVPGQHNLEHTSRLLQEFYQMDFNEEVTKYGLPLNIVLVGNNWGAGLTLKPALISLSEKHSFSVFYRSHFFHKTELLKEPEARRKLLLKAHERAGDAGEKN
ncbi:MAG: hypothetical protein P1U85_03955 [Verrucomicrobiales bacterium]|nr:hypothetical protein [Verrucomicrobiales bacterium]